MIEEIEIWKDVPEYDGYQVSSFGRVKSFKRGKEKLIKLCYGDRGYLIVCLSKNLNKKKFNVHSLVAMAFLGHKPDGTHRIVVDHKNNIKTDNRLENLQLITHRENTSKDIKDGTSKYTGVSLNKKLNKWAVNIQFKGRLIFLGYFYLEIDAKKAYDKALEEWKQGLDLNILYPIGRNKSSKHKGVFWCKRSEKWIATYKGKHIGYFITEIEAYEARENYISSLVVST